MVRQEFAEVHDTHRCARAASGRGRTARLLLHSIMLVEFRFTLLSLWAAYIQSYRHTRGLGNNERGLRNNERGCKNERCVRGNRSPNKGYIVNFSCGVIRSFNFSVPGPLKNWKHLILRRDLGPRTEKPQNLFFLGNWRPKISPQDSVCQFLFAVLQCHIYIYIIYILYIYIYYIYFFSWGRRRGWVYGMVHWYCDFWTGVWVCVYIYIIASPWEALKHALKHAFKFCIRK